MFAERILLRVSIMLKTKLIITNTRNQFRLHSAHDFYAGQAEELDSYLSIVPFQKNDWEGGCG